MRSSLGLVTNRSVAKNSGLQIKLFRVAPRSGKGDGCNPRQRRRGPAAPEGLCKTLHLRRVPRHHDIRQQRQGAGDRDQLLARSTMPGADRLPANFG